jgi:8-oxo-dGTP pyrophosphatase MutT (NUDIX family)
MQIERIKKRLTQELPGLAAQLKMAPEHRKSFLTGNEYKKCTPRLSAVVIVFFYEAENLKVVFIRRAEYVGIHAGQIAFPGGRYEETDLNLKKTALRELEEEIGIKEHEIEILGQLTDLYVPPSNFLIRAFVGYAPERPRYLIDTREVQEVVELDFQRFQKRISVKNRDFMSHDQGRMIKAPCFDIDGVVIWGATAMLLSELLDALN